MNDFAVGIEPQLNINSTYVRSETQIDSGKTTNPEELQPKYDAERMQLSHTRDASPASKPKRMSISLTASDVEKLNWLAESQDISQNEALRKAIATEQYIQQNIQTGSRVIVEKPDGSKMEVVFR